MVQSRVRVDGSSIQRRPGVRLPTVTPSEEYPSNLNTILNSTKESSGVDKTEMDEQNLPYIIMTMTALLTLLIHFILLGITVHFILTKLSPNLQKKGQKGNSEILKKFKKILDFPIKCCSSSSQVILIASKHCSQQVQPSIQVEEEDQTDAQFNPTSESQRSSAQNKEGSPIPPVPTIELPSLPSFVDQHSNYSFGYSDEDHEYEYIKLPINVNQQQYKPSIAQGKQSNCSENNVSQKFYDTLKFMPPEAKKKESKCSDSNISENSYDTFVTTPSKAEGKESKCSDNNVSGNLYDTFVFTPPKAEGKDIKHFDNNESENLYDTFVFTPAKAEGKE